MKGRLAILIVFTLLVSGFYYYFLTYHPKEKSVVSLPNKSALHLANDPNTSLFNVEAKVVYFAPNDLAEQINWPWQEKILSAMTQQRNFFKFQLGNNLDFQIYSEIIIGNNDHKYYDGGVTNNGNPNALIAAREEVLKRIFTPSGDLYSSNFALSATDKYQILIIIYEGTGASAMIYQNNTIEGPDVFKIETEGPPAIILSSAYLNSPYYLEFGSTILAHEIGHSFGLSDSNDPETGAYKENDLMGEGRRRTLNSTYISDQNKTKLGID